MLYTCLNYKICSINNFIWRKLRHLGKKEYYKNVTIYEKLKQNETNSN